MLRALMMMLVDDGVSFAAGDQVPVDGKGCDEGDREREGEACPEKQAAEPGVHRARDHDDDEVVYYLHDRDRKRVGSERERQYCTERHAIPEERQHRQPVTEEECEHYRKHYGGEVAPPKRGPDYYPQHLTDGTSRQTVQRRRKSRPVERTIKSGHGSPS